MRRWYTFAKEVDCDQQAIHERLDKHLVVPPIQSVRKQTAESEVFTTTFFSMGTRLVPMFLRNSVVAFRKRTSGINHGHPGR